jgi:hypothetical protein
MSFNPHSFNDAEPHYHNAQYQLPIGNHTLAIDEHHLKMMPPPSHPPNLALLILDNVNLSFDANTPINSEDEDDGLDNNGEPKEKVDKHIAVPINISYTLWVAKKFPNSQVPPLMGQMHAGSQDVSLDHQHHQVELSRL